MATSASKLPDAILNPSCMKEIHALQEIQKSQYLAQLEGDLIPIIRYQRALLVRLDDEAHSKVKELLDLLMDAAAGAEIIRTGLREIGGLLYVGLLQAHFGTQISGPTAVKEAHARLDGFFKEITADLLAIAVALTAVTGIKPHRPAKKPKSPYVGAAILLAVVWRRHVGKLPTTKPLTMAVKGNKKARNSISPSARFMLYALRMIDPQITSSEARTATRYAVQKLRNGLKLRPYSASGAVYSSLLEGRLRTKDGKPLLRESIRRTVTRKISR